MARKRQRRRFTGAEKVAVLKRHFVEGEAISAICEELKLQPAMFYEWQRRFFEHGARAFDAESKGAENKLKEENARLREKLQRKDTVLSELMEEHIAVKKSLGAA